MKCSVTKQCARYCLLSLTLIGTILQALSFTKGANWLLLIFLISGKYSVMTRTSELIDALSYVSSENFSL